MKKYFSVFISLLFFSYTVYAQQFSIQWQRCYGGTGMDGFQDFDTTEDGGYIFCGMKEGSCTGNIADEDMWIVKTDTAGTVLWEKCVGGSSYDIPAAIRTVPGANNGFILAGGVYSNDGDVSGNHGGLGDMWVARLDMAGNILWQQCIGGTSDDGANDIAVTADGNFVIIGTTQSVDGDATGNHGSWDILLIKINKEGNVLWKKVLGSSGVDKGSKVIATPDNDVIIGGSVSAADGDVASCNPGGDWWVAKLNSTGNILWEETFGTNIPYEELISLTGTSDGGCIASGIYSPNTSAKKLDANGVVEWSKDWEMAYVLQFPDSSYVNANLTKGGLFTGDSSFNASLMWMDKQGDSTGYQVFGGTDYDYFTKGIYYKGAYTFLGNTLSNDMDVSGNHGQGDAWVVRMTQNTTAVHEPLTAGKILLSPNPVQTVVYFSQSCNYRLYDLVGREIAIGKNTAQIDLTALPQGIYLIKLYNEKGIMIQEEKLLKR